MAESVLFGRKSEGFRIELQICRDGACGRERGRVENGYAEMPRSGGAEGRKSGYAGGRRKVVTKVFQMVAFSES